MLRTCATLTLRVDVSSAMHQEKDPTCHRSTTRMIMSFTHGSGTRGCLMAGVGTADVPAARGTSYRAAMPSGVSSGIHMVLQMHDGDKSKLRDKGILKAVVNIGVIAHKLLGMDIWEQTEIDKSMVRLLMEPRTSGVGPERISAPTQLSPFRRQSIVQMLRRVVCLSTRTYRNSQASPQTSS